jgi:hypothetical protein
MDKLTTHKTYLNSLHISSYKQRDNMNFDVISDKLGIMQNLCFSKKLLIKLIQNSKNDNTNRHVAPESYATAQQSL